VTGATNEAYGGGIKSDGTLTIENVNFEYNEADSHGGALYVTKTTTIRDSTFQYNSSSFQGGAIYADFSSSAGVLTLNTVTFTYNEANDDGGALMASYGDTSITDSSFSENAASDVGGAIVASHGSFAMTSSTVSNNTAEGYDGGGLYIADQGATIADSVISDNSANRYGGGIFTKNSISITDTTISDNTASAGGGVYLHVDNPETDTGEFSCTRCNITGNTASGSLGGGFVVGSESIVNFIDSTIANNDATTYGGACYIASDSDSSGTLNLSNVTVSTNYGGNGGGVYNKGTTTINNSTIVYNTSADPAYGNNLVNSTSTSGPLTLSNTIVAGDSTSTDNCTGDITSSGYNLDSGNSCGFSAASDLWDLDPQLDALANNGGTTDTHRPSATSPVIDMGNTSTCTTTDQTGAERRDGDGDTYVECDIGAVEY
jgi:predicted outer membrane repeat protein